MNTMNMYTFIFTPLYNTFIEKSYNIVSYLETYVNYA